ncbi:FAD-dependent oxidoreductase [Granulosicoccus sp.]|nr:FAD-dependent oxidoreductase [Granulosicoccus sp.]
MKTSDVAIVGGGFTGIYSAWKLANAGMQVTLFESAEQLGGASMSSHLWQGHWVDNGTHNLDLRSDEGYDFFSDILGSDLHIIEQHNWASTIGGQWTPGIESPDFSVNAEKTSRLALRQMQKLRDGLDETESTSRWSNNSSVFQSTKCLSQRTQSSSESTLARWYTDNYGEVLAKSINPMIRKASGSQAGLMSADALKTLDMFRRIKLGEDHEMIDLKKSSEFWDQRLAVTLSCGDERYLGMNIKPRFGYPGRQGLGGFGRHALRRLNDLGVNICTSEAVISLSNKNSIFQIQSGEQKLKSKKLLWTLPDHVLAQLIGLKTDLRQYQLPVGFSLYAFEVPRHCVAGPDYLCDFGQDTLAFRYSHPSRYTNSYTNDDFGYVLVEIPTHPKDMQVLQTPEFKKRAWQDLLASGYLHENSHYRNSICWPLMVGYSVPCPGFLKIYSEYLQELEVQLPGVKTIEPGLRGRSAFISGYEKQLHNELL